MTVRIQILGGITVAVDPLTVDFHEFGYVELARANSVQQADLLLGMAQGLAQMDSDKGLMQIEYIRESVNNMPQIERDAVRWLIEELNCRVNEVTA